MDVEISTTKILGFGDSAEDNDLAVETRPTFLDFCDSYKECSVILII